MTETEIKETSAKETSAKATDKAPSLAERIETIFATRIRGSRLSTDTEMLNLVRAAFDEVKALVAAHDAKLAADL